jgi:hypothetical protein
MNNPRLVQIQQQLNQFGVINPSQLSVLQAQISQLQNVISTFDKTNLLEYSNKLQQLYVLQSRVSLASDETVQNLLSQKVAILEGLTSNLSSS